jgi:hypothetical protein
LNKNAMPWKKFQKLIMLDQMFVTTLSNGTERSAKKRKKHNNAIANNV